MMLQLAQLGHGDVAAHQAQAEAIWRGWPRDKLAQSMRGLWKAFPVFGFPAMAPCSTIAQQIGAYLTGHPDAFDVNNDLEPPRWAALSKPHTEDGAQASLRLALENDGDVATHAWNAFCWTASHDLKLKAAARLSVLPNAQADHCASAFLELGLQGRGDRQYSFEQALQQAQAPEITAQAQIGLGLLLNSAEAIGLFEHAVRNAGTNGTRLIAQLLLRTRKQGAAADSHTQEAGRIYRLDMDSALLKQVNAMTEFTQPIARFARAFREIAGMFPSVVLV